MQNDIVLFFLNEHKLKTLKQIIAYCKNATI